MLKQLLAASIAAAFGVSGAVMAAGDNTRSGDMTYPKTRAGAQVDAQGNLARCDNMKGAQKERCVSEERAKISAAGRVEQSKPENDPAKREANKGTGNTPPQ